MRAIVFCGNGWTLEAHLLEHYLRVFESEARSQANQKYIKTGLIINEVKGRL